MTRLAAWAWPLGSVAAVSAIPLVVVLGIPRGDRQRTATRYLVGFAVGALLATAFVHLIPEAYEQLGAGSAVPLLVLAGFLGFYLLERFLRVHRRHGESHALASLPPLAALNLLGDGVHNFIDGMIIAAAYAADPGLGVVTTVAVIVHEVPQELGDVGVLLYAGLPLGRAVRYNVLSALSAVAGALLVLVVGSTTTALAPPLVPFAAGNFIYIAAADLIPSMYPAPSRALALRQAALAALGVAVVLALRAVE